MAFFKSRKGGDEPQVAARQAESIEAMRRRAKHRLIGASVLVVIGVVGFPLLFDTQPRPISVDIPIEIPDRDKVKPLAVPAPAPAVPTVSKAPPAQTAASTGPVAAAPVPAPASTPAVVASVAKAEPKPEPKPEPKVQAKVETQPADDGAKAQALLEDKPLATTPVIAEGRFVVQVGSFSDNAKAREARQKLEHAGMKTYTQVVDKDGKRLIRVRVGPFESRAEAEKAAQRVKGMDLQAAILTL
jgi:DedD protein